MEIHMGFGGIPGIGGYTLVLGEYPDTVYHSISSCTRCTFGSEDIQVQYP